MGLTTNWTEEDKFHPGCILSALMRRSLPPFGGVGLSELLTYMVDGSRNSHADDKGTILGFDFNVVPRLEIALPFLRQQFPEMAVYAEQFSSLKMSVILSSRYLTHKWLENVERQFGKSVHVDKLVGMDLCGEQGLLKTLQFEYIELNKPLFAIWWSTDKSATKPLSDDFKTPSFVVTHSNARVLAKL